MSTEQQQVLFTKRWFPAQVATCLRTRLRTQLLSTMLDKHIGVSVLVETTRERGGAHVGIWGQAQHQGSGRHAAMQPCCVTVCGPSSPPPPTDSHASVPRSSQEPNNMGLALYEMHRERMKQQLQEKMLGEDGQLDVTRCA